MPNSQTHGHTVLVESRYFGSVHPSRHICTHWVCVGWQSGYMFSPSLLALLPLPLSLTLEQYWHWSSLGIVQGVRCLWTPSQTNKDQKEKGEGIKRDVAQRRISCYPKLRTQKFQNAFYKRACFERENSVWMSKGLLCVWDASGCHVLPTDWRIWLIRCVAAWPGHRILALLALAVGSLVRGINISRDRKTFPSQGFRSGLK